MKYSSRESWACTSLSRSHPTTATFLTTSLLGLLCDLIGPRPVSLLASVLFASSYALAAQAFSHRLPLWIFLIAFFFIGMGTSALYFSALTTSAKNFSGHRGLSIAVPVAAFGLSSFWEAIVAGSSLFAKRVQASGGDVSTEVDVVRLFHFFAMMLGIVGIIGGFGLIVIPSHLPKRIEGEEGEPSEEDALIPRAEVESESSSVMSYVSAKEELTAEHRLFLREKSMYLFGLVLMVFLGSGEMFINCVRNPTFIVELTVAWDNVTNNSRIRGFHSVPQYESSNFHPCAVKYRLTTRFRSGIRLRFLPQPSTSGISNATAIIPLSVAFLRLPNHFIRPHRLASRMVFPREYLCRNQLWRNIHPCTYHRQCHLGDWQIRTTLGNPHVHSWYFRLHSPYIASMG